MASKDLTKALVAAKAKAARIKGPVVLTINRQGRNHGVMALRTFGPGPRAAFDNGDFEFGRYVIVNPDGTFVHGNIVE